MTTWKEAEQQMMSEISSMLMQRYEERKNDLTKDPLEDADEFFSELEDKAEDIDPLFAYMINFYAVKLYGCYPIPNNPFLED